MSSVVVPPSGRSVPGWSSPAARLAMVGGRYGQLRRLRLGGIDGIWLIPSIMGVCELCGRGNTSVFTIFVSGAKVAACKTCSEKRGVSIPSRSSGSQTNAGPSTRGSRTSNQRSKFEVAGDFHLRIRNARERMGISVQDLGKRLNMRAQDLQKYEGGSVPPDNVAKRIERELKIEIMVEVENDNSTPIRKGSGRTVTIADMFDEMMRDSSNG